MRTDRNRNPAAFTTDLAKQAGLKLGVDYVEGDPFPAPSTLKTARLIGDPIAVTIKLIDAVGYYTKAGRPRWEYIAMPKYLWDSLTHDQRVDVIAFHYIHEGGQEMLSLFPRIKFISSR